MSRATKVVIRATKAVICAKKLTTISHYGGSFFLPMSRASSKQQLAGLLFTPTRNSRLEFDLVGHMLPQPEHKLRKQPRVL
jgi:ribosomal protein L13|tara:strand:+ start:19708 stop:19950 length:243 start_codon:yes stop_codon:yes gene_type:complete